VRAFRKKDSLVPLLERLKFVGIFSSDLDEFFSVGAVPLQCMTDVPVK
jgi:polyphosphate kinase